MREPWFKTAWRRNVVDMHITEAREDFLSAFDPEQYVEMLQLAGIDSAVVYAKSLTGLCNYPTRVGRMHQGLKGRDIFGETVRLCHQRGIKVVAYMTIVFDQWAYEQYPDWRIMLANGKPVAFDNRYAAVCMNSPYREFITEQIEEVARNYPFEGFRIDMECWPRVCYCPYCSKRYRAEANRDLPTVVNWTDPEWVGFQRRRERWLLEFWARTTSAMKKHKPDASVEHQAATMILPWTFASTHAGSELCDFLQGDFYGDALQGSFVTKLLYRLSRNLPYGFETTSNLLLSDHTTLKPKELLRCRAYAAISNGGAFVFIDAIDPAGTLNRHTYQTMGEVFNETRAYDAYLGGTPVQDVAIYFSTESKFSMRDNGKTEEEVNNKPLLDVSYKMDYMNMPLGAARALLNNHVPYGVITKKSLSDLDRFRLLILPDLLMMDEEEVEAIRNYVHEGGLLYASRHTSLLRSDGMLQKDFMLADVFGVSYSGETHEETTYIAPTPEAGDAFLHYTERHPLCLLHSQFYVTVRPNASGARVLGKLALPITDPREIRQFASTHSDPPGPVTEHPAVVLHRYGKGGCIYATGGIEGNEHHARVLHNLLKILHPTPFLIESDAPRAVEYTVFDQPEQERLIVSGLNFQKELPNIPVYGAHVRLRLDGRIPTGIVQLPLQSEVPFRLENDAVHITLPFLDTFVMLAISYHGGAR